MRLRDQRYIPFPLLLRAAGEFLAVNTHKWPLLTFAAGSQTSGQRPAQSIGEV